MSAYTNDSNFTTTTALNNATAATAITGKVLTNLGSGTGGAIAAGDTIDKAAGHNGAQSWNATEVTLGANATLTNYLDAACAGNGGTNSINRWFRYSGDTYFVSDHEADATYQAGEDSLIKTKNTINQNKFNIRFHLYPEVTAVQTIGGNTILIQTQKNISLIFSTNVEDLMLEKSIFLARNQIINNFCINISGKINNENKIIKWEIKKVVN